MPGQAAWGLARALHVLAHIAIGGAVIAGVLLAGVAWRLSHGPLELAWLSQRIEAALNQEGGSAKLTIGSTALAWEGFSQGVDRPLDLRLTDVRVTGVGGRRDVDLPQVRLSLSIRGLLQGRVLPRAIELDSPRLTLTRASDGTIGIALGGLDDVLDTAASEPGQAGSSPPLAALLQEFARPPGDDRGRAGGIFGQLRRLRISDGSVDVIDRQLAATWHAPHAAIDLTRRAAGGVDGTAMLTLALGEQTATMTAAATLDSRAARTHLRLRLTPVAPSAFAHAVPRLTSLVALNAPVALDGIFDLDSALRLEHGRLTGQIGSGTVLISGTRLPLEEATFVMDGAPDAIALETARMALRGHVGGPPTIAASSGTLVRTAGGWDAALTVAVDRVAFADLGSLWPEDVGSGAREWVLGNINTGIAHSGHISLGVTASEDLSQIALTKIAGNFDAEGLTVHWLRPVPPIEDGIAQLRVLDPDTIEITVGSGRQRIGRAGLALKGGRVRITGLTGPDQTCAIQGEITGSLPDAIALLKEPRLGLLDRHPVGFRDPAGDAAVSLTLELPLEGHVQMKDVTIHALSHLSEVHLGGLVAGRDLDRGTLDLDATADGLSVKGRAQIAGIATQLDGGLDFRSGPASQVVQHFTATGRPAAGQLAAAGLDPNGTVFGEMPVTAVYTQRRNGEGEVALQADLTPSALAVPPLGWHKSVGVPARGSATVLLSKDRLAAIDRITVEGDGISVRGSARAEDGQIVGVRIDRAVFGRNDLHGSVALPEKRPIAVTLSGSTIDLGPKFTEKAPKKDPTPNGPPSEPAWTLDARFDRVLLAGERMATGVTARLTSDGRVTSSLHVNGQTGGTAPFAADIGLDQGIRRLTVSASDAGAVLRGLDLVRSLTGGTLTIRGSYDDRAPGHPLIGTAEIEAFRVQGAVGLAKLLQAMTLYGLVDVLRGPGIGVTRLIAPFRYEEIGLTLNDARAFSPSLGLTAKGRLDLVADRVDVEGTIVPAYFFNSLLGNLPLVGKLFSPEQGGGVFAARYAVRGPLDDPQVTVNPLSALTPGFLRDIFGIF